MKLGVIGGSGVYDLDGLQSVERRSVDTPFGSPSDEFVFGELAGREICFVPRHGRGHKLLPAEINHRANIFALKKIGVDRVLSVSAVGSLKEELRPRDMVLPDQYFDRTKQSHGHTFFGNGVVAHVGFSDPGCPVMRSVIAESAREVMANRPESEGCKVVEGGTYVNMEGPAFSTRAESNVYRGFGFDVIGMTSLPEAKLCREAELCYQSMAMVTDYDCWHEDEGPVNVEMVVAHLMANTALAREVIGLLVSRLPEHFECSCSTALHNALLTDHAAVPAEVKQRLAPILGKYM